MEHEIAPKSGWRARTLEDADLIDETEDTTEEGLESIHAIHAIHAWKTSGSLVPRG